MSYFFIFQLKLQVKKKKKKEREALGDKVSLFTIYFVQFLNELHTFVMLPLNHTIQQGESMNSTNCIFYSVPHEGTT